MPWRAYYENDRSLPVLCGTSVFIIGLRAWCQFLLVTRYIRNITTDIATRRMWHHGIWYKIMYILLRTDEGCHAGEILGAGMQWRI